MVKSQTRKGTDSKHTLYQKSIRTKKQKASAILFDQLKMEHELGVGMFGTTYLVTLKNKKYALKIQHILPESRHKSFKSEVWREMDLYHYLDKLSPKEQVFFTKLYGMHIFDGCTHIQKSSMPKPKVGAFAEYLKRLDASPWCVKYLMTYNGTTTLEHYLASAKPTQSELVSFVMQIINIQLILYKAGYSHNDLHPGNIMIKPTSTNHFKLAKTKHYTSIPIKYHGHQLVAIDYGNILHAKFKMPLTGNWQKIFVTDRDAFLFNEMFNSIAGIIFFNESSSTTTEANACKDAKLKLPWFHIGDNWSTGMQKIIKEHDMFITEKYKLYADIFCTDPAIQQELMTLFLKLKATNENISKMVKNNSGELAFWSIMARVHYEFMYTYPEQFASYFGRCGVIHIRYPVQLVTGFLKCKDVPELISFFSQV